MHALKTCQTLSTPLGTPQNQAKAPCCFLKLHVAAEHHPSQLSVLPAPSKPQGTNTISKGLCLLFLALRSFQDFSNYFLKEKPFPEVLGT